MKRKGIIAMLLVAVVALALLAGCGQSNVKKPGDEGNGSSEGANEKTNIKFYIWSDGENYTKEIAKNYNESQDKVNVEVVSTPNETYDDSLKVMLSGGSDADLVNLRSLNLLTQLQETGALLEVSDKVKNGDLDISKYGPRWDTCYPDGRVFGLPMRSSTWMLFYNKDLLDEAGLTMPEQLTWDEYADMAKQLTSGDGKEYGGIWVDWNIYHVIGTQMGTYLNDDDIEPVKKGLEILNRLINEDKSHVPLAEVKANDSLYLADFENERVAMLPQGEWLFNMLMSDIEDGKTDINWDVAPLPVPEGVASGTTWGAIQFTGIPKDSKHPDEAYDFLEYLCGEGGAAVLPKYGIIPAYSSDKMEEVFKETIGKESAAKVVFNAKTLPEAPSYEKYNDLVTAFSEHAELYLFGEKTIEETMENFEKQRDGIMSR